MGTGINVQCIQCRYNGSFMLGTGSYYVLMDNCLEAMPARIVKEVKTLMQKHTIMDFKFDYKLYQCDDCLFLFDHGTLKVEFVNNRIYENKVKCPACENELTGKHTPIEQIHDLTCPICQESELYLFGQMDWD